MTDKIFFIGNSLTWDTLPKNLDGIVQYHIAPNRNLQYIFDNPTSYVNSSAIQSTSWLEQLTTQQFDYIVVQPFQGTTLNQDVEIISHWMTLQPDAVFIIHTGWNSWLLHEEIYYSENTATSVTRSQDYFLDLLENLSTINSNREIRTTRALEILAKIDQDIKLEISPFNYLSSLYRDGIHMTDGIRTDNGIGRYLMHNIMRLALHQQIFHNPIMAEKELSPSSEINHYLAEKILSLGEEIVGNLDNNNLQGSINDDVIIGGKGKDTLYGGDGNDILTGGEENDHLFGGEGNNLLYGKMGNDYLSALTGNDTLLGNDGNDTLLGNDGDDNLLGGDGKDRLTGGRGNDTLKGERGSDRLFGGDGSDILMGGNGNDTLDGGMRNDQIFGDDGFDSLTGDNGNDTLNGRWGNDTLTGGLDNDILTGDKGKDVFRFLSPIQGIDQITDFSPFDDIIEISQSSFDDTLPLGSLNPNYFAIATQASTPYHRFFYDSTNGDLWFDIDGNDIQSPQKIASLNSYLNLTPQHIVII